MKIVNPIYDQAFKYLMEHEGFAKQILSIILDTEVVEVTPASQEMHIPHELRTFSLYRLDFRALIRDKEGRLKTVLVELQKSKHSTDIIRFRNYLAANYRVGQTDKTAEEPASGYAPFYPIITVYLLGYHVTDLPYMAVKVDREVINLSDNQRIDSRSAFIKYLTHQAYIIQLSRLPAKPHTRLEQLFSLFNQKWVTDDGFAIDLPEVPEGFSDMVSYLQQPLLSEEFRRRLEFEYEADTWAWEYDQKMKKLTEERDGALREMEEERKQKEEECRLKEEERRQKEEERRQKESERNQKEEIKSEKRKIAQKLAAFMMEQGIPVERIIQETGLERGEIEKSGQ